jgi:hypothetical protein
MQIEEASRVIACNVEEIKGYFDTFAEQFAKFSDVGGQCRIYNMDESPMMQLGRWLKGVVAPVTKGDVKRIGGNSKATMREMTTIVTCFSPSHLIPHAFILKASKRASNPLAWAADTMPGAVIIANPKSAMMNGDILVQWLEHFASHVPGGVSPSTPVLLLMDSHASRTDERVIARAKELGVDILLPPGNTTSVLQPCDQIFAAFKTRLRA